MTGRTKWNWPFAILFAALATLPAAGAQKPAPPEAVARLAAVRAAMGGAERLAAIKTLRLKGGQKALVNNLRENRLSASEPLPLEYRIALPDRFLYIHAAPRNVTPPSRGGFVGRTALIPGMDVRGSQQMMGYLVFPVFLITDSAFPVTLVGVTGNTLRFQDRDRGAILLDLDPATNLPNRIRYTDRDYQQGDKSERVRDIGDYRRVGDLLLAHRLTAAEDQVRALGVGLYFDTIEINPPLTPADFRR